jgi:hypothetical protein
MTSGMHRVPRQSSICIGLAVVTTVVLAWACVWMLPDQLALTAVSPPNFEWLKRHRRSPERQHSHALSHGFGVRVDLYSSPRNQYSRIFAMRFRAGFPFMCLDGGHWDIIPEQPVKPWGETLRTEAVTALRINLGADDGVTLPIRPTWGFAANTAIFAIAWWVLLYAPGTVLRSFRRRSGRCPQCGYDLHGNESDGCPECGWRRERAVP